MLASSVLAQIACLLEATARKPGNVHRFRDFDDAHYVDFLLSAAAIGPALERARRQCVGQTILEAVRLAQQATATNTNLGIILLLVPLAAANEPFRADVEGVLEGLTVEDARLAYEAIRQANPGGLGKVPAQDIAAEPTLTLREVMRLAADRDLIARQYANAYQDVFEFGEPAFRHSLDRNWPVENAIVYCHLQWLASFPDSLIARKRGWEEAADASRRAAQVLEAGWPHSVEGQSALEQLDAWLRASGHARNPGTTADLVTASLFLALRQGTMQLPLQRLWQC
jgi:triphosphoribosyl-dephospho-CoA synthase